MKKNLKSQADFQKIISQIPDEYLIVLENIRLDHNEIYTDQDIMKMFRISYRTLCNYRKNNIISHFKIGGKCLYLKSVLLIDIIKAYNK